ncbi:MAG: pilin [bacterium]|nr:pilin [bacterium]
MSWTSTRFDHTHDLRVDFKPNNGSSCRDGWFCSDPPDKLVRLAGTSLTMAVTPGAYYDWWVHSVWADSLVGAPSYGSFTCRPTPKGDINASPTSVNICSPATSGSTTLSGSANVSWDVRQGSSTGALVKSGNAGNFSFSATVGMVGTTFYLAQANSVTVLDSVVINSTANGCSPLPAGCTDIDGSGSINEQDCRDSRNATCTLCSVGETPGEICNNNGFCDSGETVENCLGDCFVGPPAPEGGTTTGPYKPPAAKEFKFSLTDKIGLGTPEGLIGAITTWIFNVGITVAFIIIIWAGIKMLTAAGNDAQFRQGREMLKYAIIGLAVIFIGAGFVSLVKNFLGAS